jgi:hypothetical protein
MYIIVYTAGSWDDYSSGHIFITEDEEIAKKYCIKANSLLLKIKEFVRGIDSKIDELGNDSDGGVNVKLWCKYHTMSDVNEISYKQIEKR